MSENGCSMDKMMRNLNYFLRPISHFTNLQFVIPPVKIEVMCREPVIKISDITMKKAKIVILFTQKSNIQFFLKILSRKDRNLSALF